MLIQLDGVTLALLSAALFGASGVAARKALVAANTLIGAMITIIIGLPLLFVVAFLNGEFLVLKELTFYGFLVFGLAGITNFLLGTFFTYRAIKGIGVNITSSLITTFPVYASLLALIFLQEDLAINRMAAIVLVVAGGLVLSKSNLQTNSDLKLDKLQFRQGVAFGVLAGFCFGLSHVLTKIGVETTPLPITGVTISYSFATLGYLLLLASTPSRFKGGEDVKRHLQQGMSWFFIAGFFNAGALIFSYLAFQGSPVTIVSPILAAQSLFTILFSYLAIRELELFHVTVILGALLVLSGVAILYLPPLL
jgi:drug/metabolite transporter (DMT)-like permease